MFGFGFGFIFLLAIVIIVTAFVAVFAGIVSSMRRVHRFQDNVFHALDNQIAQNIDQAQRPNRTYIKTACDNCGAKCTNASDISPSGDLKCDYCGSWFNVLRSLN